MAKEKMTEIKAEETGFGTLELKIAKPSLNPDKTMSISGNFETVKANIQKVVDRYKDVQLTEDNVAYVKTLKGQFVSLRTGIDRERKEYKKVYITPAGKLVDSMCDELLAVVAEGEKALGEQLEAYDQRRKDELTVILQEYVDEAVSKYALREEYAKQIKLLDKYYNKTQNEEDSIDDIDAQACELAKKQKEYDSGVELIKAECTEAGFLPDAYIRDLQYKSAMEIILEIKSDKKTNAEILAKAETTGKITVGEPVSEALQKELEAAANFEESAPAYRERVMRVRYKSEQAKIMADFFKKNNIQFEFIKTDF